MNSINKKVVSIVIGLFLLTPNMNVAGMDTCGKEPLLKGDKSSLAAFDASALLSIEIPPEKDEDYPILETQINKNSHSSPILASDKIDTSNTLLSKIKSDNLNFLKSGAENSIVIQNIETQQAQNKSFIENELPAIINKNKEERELLQQKVNDYIKENKNLKCTIISLESEVDRLNVEVNDRCSICIPIDTITCGTLKLSKRCNGKFWNGCFCGTIVSILIFVGCYIIIFTTR